MPDKQTAVLNQNLAIVIYTTLGFVGMFLIFLGIKK